MKVLTICKWCKKEFYAEETELKRGGGKYCSQKCYHLSHRTGKTVNCLQCKKPFHVSEANLKNGRGKYCSKVCRDLAHRIGERTIRNCLTCGKPLYVKDANLKRGDGKYCSKECAGIARRQGEIVNCLVCGKQFYAKRAHLKIGKGKFCCNRCSRKAQKMPTTHTIPERIFGGICEKSEIGTEYTGDSKIWIDNINPDFVYYNGRKRYAIFINGDYWHSPFLRPDMTETQRPEYQIKTCKEHRWKPIVIWESDLKREDAEAFVLNLLKKEGILAQSFISNHV